MNSSNFFYLLTGTLLISSIVNAQDYQSNVQTPKGSQVVAYITSESSDVVREAYDTEMRAQYPNAIIIETYYNSTSTKKYSSSRRFNCHGYA